MFNLSTLSGINLQTDNYFQYTSKRKGVSDEMYLRLVSNVLAFWSKRKCVFYQDLFVSFLSCFIYCVGVILYFFLNEAVKYD